MDIHPLTTENGPYIEHASRWQLAFHRLPHKYRYFAGGFRSGKTTSACVEGIKAAFQYPGSRGLVGRKTEGSLKDTTWRVLRGLIPGVLIRSESELKITLVNGSEILGYHMQNYETIAGLDLSWFYIDEIQEIEQSMYRQLCGRLSYGAGPHKGWVTGTPKGRTWVRKLFVESNLPKHAYIKVRTADNLHNLPVDYLDDLRLIYDDDWIGRMLEGDEDIYEGQIFDMFDTGVHVIRPFQIPAHWPRFRGIDHGIANPTACVFGAVSEAGDLFVTDLYYERGRDPMDNARAILDKSRAFENKVVWTVGDPSMNRREAGGQAAKLYRDAGLNLLPGENAVRPSITKLRQLFRIDPTHEWPQEVPRPADVKGSPRLFIFQDCQDLIWEVNQYHWADLKDSNQKSKEKPAETPDHAIDALRYLVMKNPFAAIPPSAKSSIFDHLKGLLKRDKGPKEQRIARLDTEITPIERKGRDSL